MAAQREWQAAERRGGDGGSGSRPGDAPSCAALAACRIDRRRGAQPHRRGRRHLHHRRRGPPADRRAGRHVVRQCRAPPARARRGDGRAGDGALLQHALVHDERAVCGARRAARRPCPWRPRPCLLHHRRLLGGRDRAALHAVLQQCARPAREEADRLAAAAPITARPTCRPRSTAARATATGWTAPTSWSSSCRRRTRSAVLQA